MPLAVKRSRRGWASASLSDAALASPSCANILAEAIAREAFHNVSYFPGTFEALRAALK
jgi:hypothetical protein